MYNFTGSYVYSQPSKSDEDVITGHGYRLHAKLDRIAGAKVLRAPRDLSD
jgi:hypothetical protein